MSVKCFTGTKYQAKFEEALKTMSEQEAIVKVIKDAYRELNNSLNRLRSQINLPEEDVNLEGLDSLIKGDNTEEALSLLDRLLESNKSKKGNLYEGDINRNANFDNIKPSDIYSDNFKKDINKLDKVLDTIRRNVDSVSQRSAATRGADNDTSKKFERVVKVIDNFSKIAPKIAILKFIDFADKELKSLNSNLEKRIADGKIDSNYLFRANAYASIYSTLDDIEDVLDNQKSNMDEEEFKKFDTAITNARKNYARFYKRYISAAKEELTALLAPYNTEPYVERHIQLERQYNSVKPTKNKEEWINDMLETEKDFLQQKQYEETRKMMDEIPMDIHNISAYITSEKNQNSLLIKLFSTVVDGADLQIREFALKSRRNFAAAVKAADLQGSNNKKKYEDILSTDSNGMYYLISEYKPEFHAELESKRYAVEKAKEEHGRDSKEVTNARKVLKKWIDTNTVKEGKVRMPTDKWKDSRFNKLDGKKKVLYDFLLKELKEADKNTMHHKSLIIKSYGTEFYRIPAVRRTDLDRILSGDPSIVADKLGDFYKVRQDETKFGELENQKVNPNNEFDFALTTVNNEERLLVPIHFRGRIKKRDQSLDLPTIFMMNSIMSKEYAVKQALEADSNLLLDIVGEADVYRTTATTKKKVISFFTRDMENPDFIRIPGKDSNVYKKLNNVIQNRIYNIFDASKGKLSGDRINVIANSVMKYTADLTLMVNWMSAVPNMFQGKIQNFIEGVGGSTFSRKDLRWGEATYWAEMSKEGFGDIGRNINHSKLNLVIDHLNILTDFTYSKHDFEKDNRFKALFNGHTLHAFNNMAEHYAQSTLMLAVMSNIKVLNKDGKMIDRNGNPTKDKAKAMNLYQAYEVKDGVPTINSNVVSTTFNPLEKINERGLVQIQNLIRKKIIDLHGQYDTKLQSTMQRYWFGKAITMFRRWMIPAFYRRWRGAYYTSKDYDELTKEQRYFSLETQQFEEGTYTSFIRFLRKGVIPAIKEMKIELASTKWDQLTDYEKSNVHKTVRELLVMSMMMTAAFITAMAAKDAPDDEAEILYTLAYIFKRQESELQQYYSPTDTLRIFRSPFAAINTLTKLTGWMNQMLPHNIGEQYKNGERKGEYKAWVKTKKMIPVIAQTERSAEQSFNYLENLLTY